MRREISTTATTGSEWQPNATSILGKQPRPGMGGGSQEVRAGVLVGMEQGHFRQCEEFVFVALVSQAAPWLGQDLGGLPIERSSIPRRLQRGFG